MIKILKITALMVVSIYSTQILSMPCFSIPDFYGVLHNEYLIAHATLEQQLSAINEKYGSRKLSAQEKASHNKQVIDAKKEYNVHMKNAVAQYIQNTAKFRKKHPKNCMQPVSMSPKAYQIPV